MHRITWFPDEFPYTGPTLMRRDVGSNPTLAFARARRAFLVACCVSPIAMASRAQAGALASAQQLFSAGSYGAAAEAAERAGGAAGLALSARALLAESFVTEGTTDDAPRIERAIRNAESAIAADPANVEGRLQLALGLGMKARRMDLMAAFRGGYAQTGKRLLDEAVALNPREPWAWTMMAAWHLEVIRRGGMSGAMTLGASRDTARQAIDRAGQLAPNDPSVTFNRGVATLEIDPSRNAASARALLARAVALPAQDAFGRQMKINAGRVMATIDASGGRDALRLVYRMFG
jgi:tetratricopeptide (TPR) repeat protein